MPARVLPQNLAGRYEVKQILGDTSTGVTYWAYDTLNGREVALKVLRGISDSATLQGFYEQYHKLAAIAHPNLIEILEVGEFKQDGQQQPYFSMPLLSGVTLDDLIRTASHMLTVGRTVEIVFQACCGLQAVHDHGLVHGDLKPSNIFLLQDDSVRVFDFGFGAPVGHPSGGEDVRTPIYLSPEQIQIKPASPLSDIFSLGVICYEGLTGRQPFRRAKGPEIINAILCQTPPPASDLNSAVSQAISQILRRAMAKQPQERFSSALEFGKALQKASCEKQVGFNEAAPPQGVPDAQRLRPEGPVPGAGKQFEQGVRLLRQIPQGDGSSRMTAAQRCDALLEDAQSLLDHDWRAAEELVRQALDLDPGHPQARNLRTLILRRKREEFVQECLSDVGQLRATGDVRAALARVEAGLSIYFSDSRLIQMRETLEGELASQAARGPHSEREGGSPERQTSTTGGESGAAVPSATRFFSPDAKSPIASTAPAPSTAVIPKLPSDAAATRLFSPRDFAPSEGTSAPSPRRLATVLGLADRLRGFARRWPLPWLDLAGTIARLRARPGIAISMVGLAILLILAWPLVRLTRRRPAVPAVVMVTVQIHTSPQGATIRVNDAVRGVSDLDLTLPAGSYRIDAQMDGYQPASSLLDAETKAPNSVELALQPALPILRMIADNGTGKVWLDGEAEEQTEGVEWASKGLAPGEHKFRFVGSEGQASFKFTSPAATLPALVGTLSANGVHALLVSSLGNRLRVYCNPSPAKVNVDGQTEIEVGANGADMPAVPAGDHTLSLSLGKDRHTVDLGIGSGPTLAVYLLSDQNIGTLVVTTGEDDMVQVYLDGQLQKHETRGGQLRIPNLAPKDYVVRVAKSGFQDVAEQKVTIHKGEQARVAFKLEAIPHLAALAIEGAPAQSEILIDGQPVGTVQSDGTFHLAVKPGDHVIELRKDRFEPKTVQKHFVADATVNLAGTESALKAASGQLRITFSPAEAAVTLEKGTDPPIKVSSGSNLTLAPGRYDLIARVGDFSRSAPVEVAAGDSRTIGPIALAPGTIQDFQDPAAWRPNQDWFVRRGGGFALYQRSPLGTFVFSVILQKGHRLSWVLNYSDDQNYGLFQMDENFFYRSEVRDGKTTEEAKIPFRTEKKKARTFQVVVTAGRILHQIQQGNGWVDLDSWTQPGRDLSAGKFGFYLADKDEVAVSNFSHYGELHLHPE